MYYRQHPARVLANPLMRVDNSFMNWELIREKLAQLIETSGLSHNDLQTKSGVPQPTISRFMNGETQFMQLDNLAALAKALDSTVAEIIGERPLQVDLRTRRVLKAMEVLPDYKKEVLVNTAETLAKGEKKSA
jgi:predicted XRE-type DNA-binding protein